MSGLREEHDEEPASGELVVLRSPGLDLPAMREDLAEELEVLVGAATDYSARARAKNTTKAYASDWRHFEGWCSRYGLRTLPADAAVLELYVTSLATDCKMSTIRRRVSAIARAHRENGLHSATSDNAVKKVIEGIARAKADQEESTEKKAALLRDPLLRMIAAVESTTPATRAAALAVERDRALLLVGFALALRRSELVAMKVAHLSPTEDGIAVRIPKSKTDQLGKGEPLLLVTAKNGGPCAVTALRSWLTSAGITRGFVFRRITSNGRAIEQTTKAGELYGLSAQSVALIVKRHARAAGLDPAELAAHSLRSGYATQAARDGHRQEQIAKVTRHKDLRTLAGYIRAGEGAKDVAHVL